MSAEAWVMLVLLIVVVAAFVAVVIWLGLELRAARTRATYFETETRSLLADLARNAVEAEIEGDPLPDPSEAVSDRERRVLERLHEADARIRGLGATGQADD